MTKHKRLYHGRLTVGTHNYRVYIAELKDLYGVTYPERHEIVIGAGLTRDRFNETLLHEALHALLDMSGGAYALQTPVGHREELLVRAITPHLPGLMCALKGLMR